MRVPTRLAQNVFALHHLIARDKVLDTARKHVTDVRFAVGCRRSVVKGKGPVALCRGLFKNFVLLPEFKHVEFAPDKVHGSVYLFVLTHRYLLVRVFVVYFFILFVVLSIYRIIIRHSLIIYCAKGKHKRYAVFIGGGNNMQMLFEEMEGSLASIYEVVGYFDIVPNDIFSSQCPYLGSPDSFADFMSGKTSIKHVFCSLSMEQGRYNFSIMNYCENHLLYFHGVPNVCKGFPRRIWHSMVGNMPILNLRYEPLSKMENRILKRIFDIVLSGIFLITIFPFVFLIVGSIIKLTSPGPILFKQMRTGLNGVDFLCYKFRSMKVNDEADSKQATIDDPRKTRFGDFLRRSNIDEFPQFINVFKGEMSIVGPRPHMLSHTETYAQLIDKYMVRHFIKPGVTGWAQTHGFRGETRELSQMEERVKADIWYMEHWTILLDLYIIYKTIVNVVVGEKNAY